MSQKQSQTQSQMLNQIQKLTNKQFKDLIEKISKKTDYEIDKRITVKSIMYERNQDVLEFVLENLQNKVIRNEVKDIIDFGAETSQKQLVEEQKQSVKQQKQSVEEQKQIKQPRLKKPAKIIKSIPIKETAQKQQVVDVSKLYDFLSLDEIRSSLPGIRTIQKQYEQGKFDQSEFLSQLNQTLTTARANNKGFDTNLKIAIQKSIQNSSQSSARGNIQLNESDQSYQSKSQRSNQSIQFDKLARAINPKLQRSYDNLKNMSIDGSLSNAVRSEISAIKQRIEQNGSQFSLSQTSAVDKFIQNVQHIQQQQAKVSDKSMSPKMLNQLKEEVKIVDKSVKSQLQKQEQQSISKEIIDTEMQANRDDVTPDNEISSKTSGLDQSKLNPGSSFGDILENTIIQDAILTQKEKANLTHDQQALFDNIFGDEQAIIDNAAELDQSILNQSSFDEMFGSFQFGKSFLQDIPGTQNAILDIEAVSSKGEILTARQIINAIPTIIKKIGEIEGKIDLTQKNLNQYKKQTTIYKQQIQYKESNDFKIKSGTAFRTRVCC